MFWMLMFWMSFMKRKDEDSIKCVIITGSGDKAFVGGADNK